MLKEASKVLSLLDEEDGVKENNQVVSSDKLADRVQPRLFQRESRTCSGSEPQKPVSSFTTPCMSLASKC